MHTSEILPLVLSYFSFFDQFSFFNQCQNDDYVWNFYKILRINQSKVWPTPVERKMISSYTIELLNHGQGQRKKLFKGEKKTLHLHLWHFFCCLYFAVVIPLEAALGSIILLLSADMFLLSSKWLSWPHLWTILGLYFLLMKLTETRRSVWVLQMTPYLSSKNMFMKLMCLHVDEIMQ